MALDWTRFDTLDALSEALAERILGRLQAAIDARGRASLLVSGGSTPRPLFKRLSQTPFDWAHVQIALVDERWVTEDHPRANTRFLHETLLKGEAAAAEFIPMLRKAGDVFEVAGEVDGAYQALAFPFDVVLLGLGPDGHTASLFPGARGLEDAFSAPMDRLVMPIEAVPSDVTGDEVQRLTLTPTAIAEADWPVLMISGAEKAAIAEQAAMGDSSPFGRVVQLLDRPLSVYWAP